MRVALASPGVFSAPGDKIHPFILSLVSPGVGGRLGDPAHVSCVPAGQQCYSEGFYSSPAVMSWSAWASSAGTLTWLRLHIEDLTKSPGMALKDSSSHLCAEASF